MSLGFERFAVLGATGGAGRSVVAELMARAIPTRVVSRGDANLGRDFAGAQIEQVVADLADPTDARQAVSSCDAALLCVGLPLAEFSRHPAIAGSSWRPAVTPALA